MSEKKALETVKGYMEAFNAQDVEAMKDKLNFPFSWIINNKVRPVQKREEFVSPIPAMIEREEWHHTELDSAEPFQVWDRKAHFRVVYSRFKADGTKYATHDALWIVTVDDGHWGVQCMSFFLPELS